MNILLKENNIDSINFETCECNLGTNLAELAYKYLKAGGDFNFAKLKPLYIQPPSISMPKSGKV
jgi:hypothetical protein